MSESRCEAVFPTTPGLQKGVRVRVTTMNRMPRYDPGDKGMIVRGRTDSVDNDFTTW